MLTAEQKSYFVTFGFLVIRRYYSPEEMRAISHEANGVWASDRGRKTGQGHTAEGR